ncbi:DUF1190 domain-containing protein [Rhodobacter sphaeroides]|jgi:Predicted integral membrane protein|uniref:Integral membrane protein n=1 Tax=Cereibacter sphaeroides (strain ATCC 17023 / DSM 158 / JCM 6121 / CCUG 31486 / LMG 2827 / NBRC 12203 / NCIMB 8253 / ATH 2.4.1.) TaxID=272943 RepID=Q3IWQ5_CERS4|nr:DUF1190 domain-containing protein [Cereibacter sphaeroides]ABA81029.1 putative integral membrane protein [Cereibacter sphaeroides 2.4.1]AMJ49344.1 hypothetical protein APX01_17445 [Cereibacter sphaeroides]ANS36052.1 hypothetical protein A3858_17445 [Cereibacter sphaeroides]ATN65117.1 hypothetical protein A3857_17460 [Cereibacter sphaeroides]AXC63322.1 DUF1190 domain-containing protein [Cereibacter sphaeroides 2.4.1]
MRRRSRTVALVILGAASFALAGCREEEVEAQAFPDVESCRAAASNGGLFSVEECDKSFAEAQQLHVESAPRYDSVAACEAEHGAGGCGSESEVTGGSGMGGIFMPLLTGYLIGSMLSGRGVASAQPLYRTADGKFTNAARTSTYSSNTGSARLGTSTFARPPSTIGKPPMSVASPASRGGFGSTGASRGFGG